MKEIGDILRRKRTEKKYTQEYINSQTHIPLRYISAIEDGDLSLFPAEVYYLGSLRRYAKFLGLNDEDLVGIYRHKVIEAELSKSPDLRKPLIKLSKSFYGILVISVLVFFTGLYMLMQYEASSFSFKSKLGSLISFKKVSTGIQSEKLQADKKYIAKGLKLRIECIETTWLKVVADENMVFEGLMRSGMKKEWKANEQFYLSIGYVPGIKVSLNEKPIDVTKGARQDVNSVTLTKDDLEAETDA